MLESVGSNGLIQLWLNSYPNRFSEQNRNYYPLGATSVVAIVATMIAAWVTDVTPKRWPVK